ncbi:hypothetical protein O1611_g6660 [Lasiodiplodia mahajangana]|uniref:Uncharacterized protein n=1 Tax=Lasiodiplodia mahajangana TaxID=1108764 RepID=A0ACC2JHW4_9PEZI|nr:hypothetical protein O1611_g6660 [Lasiodiplodia mahajangana]
MADFWRRKMLEDAKLAVTVIDQFRTGLGEFNRSSAWQAIGAASFTGNMLPHEIEFVENCSSLVWGNRDVQDVFRSLGHMRQMREDHTGTHYINMLLTALWQIRNWYHNVIIAGNTNAAKVMRGRMDSFARLGRLLARKEEGNPPLSQVTNADDIEPDDVPCDTPMAKAFHADDVPSDTSMPDAFDPDNTPSDAFTSDTSNLDNIPSDISMTDASNPDDFSWADMGDWAHPRFAQGGFPAPAQTYYTTSSPIEEMLLDIEGGRHGGGNERRARQHQLKREQHTPSPPPWPLSPSRSETPEHWPIDPSEDDIPGYYAYIGPKQLAELAAEQRTPSPPIDIHLSELTSIGNDTDAWLAWFTGIQRWIDGGP